MYGRDEYHDTRARELLASIKQLLGDAEPETLAALKKMVPVNPPLLSTTSDLEQALIRQAQQARALDAQSVLGSSQPRCRNLFAAVFGNSGL